jgi:hypothetical protein
MLFSTYIPTYLQFILLWIFAYLLTLLYQKLACSKTYIPTMTSIIVLYVRQRLQMLFLKIYRPYLKCLELSLAMFVCDFLNMVDRTWANITVLFM